MSRQTTIAQKELILKRRDSGATYAQLTAEFGVSAVTLARWLKGTKPSLGKKPLSKGKLSELRKTLKALPDEQLDAVISGTAPVVAVAKALALVLRGQADLGRVLVMSLRQLHPGKTGAAVAKHIDTKGKGAARLDSIDPTAAIQQQLASLVGLLRASEQTGDATRFASLSRLLPGLLRELRRFMPPDPAPSDEQPDMILAAAATREKFHVLIQRVIAEEREK